VSGQLGPAGRWFHYGLTSADVVDTALSLQIREAGALILEGVDAALAAVVARAEQHRLTECIGRTHGVHAEPTTFGLKLAVWAFELDRSRTRVTRALEGIRVGKLSGAVGQYAAIDPEVERIVLPDSFQLAYYVLVKFRAIVEGMHVYPERMRENLEASFGLVFSQPVLLALVEAGRTRDDAYRIVQRAAMRTWETEQPFLEVLRADDDVRAALSDDRLVACFSLDAALVNIDRIFAALDAADAVAVA